MHVNWTGHIRMYRTSKVREIKDDGWMDPDSRASAICIVHTTKFFFALSAFFVSLLQSLRVILMSCIRLSWLLVSLRTQVKHFNIVLYCRYCTVRRTVLYLVNIINQPSLIIVNFYFKSAFKQFFLLNKF